MSASTNDCRAAVSDAPALSKCRSLGIGLDGRRLRERFTCQDAAVEGHGFRPDQAQIGRNHVPSPQQHEVAGHEFARRHILYVASAPHASHGRRGIAQRLQGLFATILGDNSGADDRGQDHQDEQAVAYFVEGNRQAAGDEKQDDERFARSVP